jgi:hypothetical protein
MTTVSAPGHVLALARENTVIDGPPDLRLPWNASIRCPGGRSGLMSSPEPRLARTRYQEDPRLVPTV